MNGDVFSMRGALVNPSSSKLRIRSVSIIPTRNKVYGYNPIDGASYTIDIGYGVVSRSSALELPMTRDSLWYSDFSMRIEGGVCTYPYGRSPDFVRLNKPEQQLTDEQLWLVIALINQRVDGEELDKGLRARGVTLPYKLESNYLDGWQIKGSREELNLTRLLFDVTANRSE